ncbi:MAG TPA: hypothetical protein VGP63_07520 [Planctomycetaceae bacterium]|nr:hypothetical protein [Planctomycetaceae bacterium]
MNNRPNLPVVLATIAVLCSGQSVWAADQPAAGVPAKVVSKGSPRPTQKPLATLPVSAAPAAPTAAPVTPAPNGAPTTAPTAPAKSPATATPSPAPVPTDPLVVLRTARERLTGNREKQSPNDVQSIRARIVERVTISGRKFRLEGSYLQGTDLRLRLELKVIPESTPSRVAGTLLEVCNGTILWANYQVGKQTRITRRDVSQILAASKTNGQINFSTVELGLGGLPALLASLDRWMKFDSVSQQEINGKKFTVLAGAWKDSCRKDLLGKMSKQHLPEHVPDAVRIYLEPELLFPRRIAFLKQRDKQFESLVELDLLDIVINGPLDEHQFEYAPPDGARPVDVTTEYVQQLQNAAP